MNDLEERILEAINRKRGQKAKDIAAELRIDRNLVNSALYGSLRGMVRQDKSYRWYPRNAADVGQPDEVPRQLTTPLARLCRYYLECLSHDDLGGVSEFATSMYGDPNYVELQVLPMLTEERSDPFASENARRLLSRIRRDRNRQVLYLGYPVRLKFVRSRKGWEGFMVEPLLLFPFRDPDTGYATPTLTEDMPYINFRALRALANAGETSLMEEAIQIAEELGLSNTEGEQPDIDELFKRLCDIRPEWDWQEEIDPYVLSGGPPLSSLNQQGIFNRAVLIGAERSPYTKGLSRSLECSSQSKRADAKGHLWVHGLAGEQSNRRRQTSHHCWRCSP